MPTDQSPARRVWASTLGFTARLERPLWVLFLLAILSRALSPDIIGILNNDSIHYLERAQNPAEYGLVFQGFRQAGYPLVLGAISIFTDLTPYDLFFATALLQRILLLVGLGYLAVLLRWWAAPVLVFLSMPTLVTTTNLLLTEAVSIPLAVFLACLLVHACGLGRSSVVAPRRALLLMAGVSVLAMLVLIKFQFAALLLPVGGVALTLWRSRRLSPKAALLVVAVPSLLIGLLAFGQAIENQNETGEFLPVSESARAAWYSAYVSVFSGLDVPPPPALAPYYDGGDLYVFLHGLEKVEDEYLVRRRIILARIDDLFTAAGTTHGRERVDAFVGFLQLGERDDLGSLVTFIRQRPIAEVASLNERNFFAVANGVEALYAKFNDGQVPSFLTTSAVALAIGPDDYRSVRLWVLPLAMAVLAASTFLKEVSWIALGTLLMVLAIAAAHAYYYTSNSRYTLPSAAVAVIVASAFLPHLRRVLGQGVAERSFGSTVGN